MTRQRNPFDALVRALACALLLAAGPGCRQTSGIGPVFATSQDLPARPRRPDGVAVDPTPGLSAPSDATKTDDPVAVLRPPLSEKAVRALLASFFRSIASENPEALASLLTSDAVATTRSRGGSALLIDHWRARMRRLGYRRLPAEAVYDDANVEIYRHEDLDIVRSGRPVRPPTMTRSDLLARVPIATPRAGNDRLFGDEILFLLRRDTDTVRIREVLEDFQLP